jgi:hypothetical protein
MCILLIHGLLANEKMGSCVITKRGSYNAVTYPSLEILLVFSLLKILVAR